MAAEASMFTGIVREIGTLAAHDGARLSIACSYEPSSLVPGASIACDGCCLTIVDTKARKSGAVFEVDVSNETVSRTALGSWQVGRRINLERHAPPRGPAGAQDLLRTHISGVSTT